MKVSVVIPYYQIQGGILQRALKSVLAQTVPLETSVDIIVVDDGSPAPARMEAEALKLPDGFQLKIIEQTNAGVSSARNKVLQSIGADSDCIAFLDSDDSWLPGFLSTALAGLDVGADLFFCDSLREGNAQSTFSEKSFGEFISKFGTNRRNGLFELEQKAFYKQSIQGRAFLIPTVVYRRGIAPDLLFNTDLRVCGEDCLFLFQLIEKCKRICCTTEALVHCGKGVNIHGGMFGWESANSLVLYMNQILACYKWREKLSLPRELDEFLVTRIRRLRALFSFLAIRYFLKKRQLWPKELVQAVRCDSSFIWWYPLYSAYVVVGLPLGFYDPKSKW